MDLKKGDGRTHFAQKRSNSIPVLTFLRKSFLWSRGLVWLSDMGVSACDPLAVACGTRVKQNSTDELMEGKVCLPHGDQETERYRKEAITKTWFPLTRPHLLKADGFLTTSDALIA